MIDFVNYQELSHVGLFFYKGFLPAQLAERCASHTFSLSMIDFVNYQELNHVGLFFYKASYNWLCFPLSYDSDGNRTRVTTVKGWCLNRLTTEPHFFLINENYNHLL